MAEDTDQLSGLLAAAEEAAPVDCVDVVARNLRRRLAAEAVSFLIVDLSKKAAVRMRADGGAESGQEPETIELAGSVYAQVVRTQRPHQEPAARGTRVIAPVSSRGDVLGLLEAWLPDAGPAEVGAVCETARTLAYLVIVNQRFTDLYTWGRRTTPLSLPAEIQYQLLPASLSCQAPEFAVAGVLEPSASISGDTFDYAQDRHTLHLSVTDPMGHDLNAALTATVLVGALRGARRVGAGVAEQARRADKALLELGRGHATGQLLRIGLADGRAQFVNAGHPWPWRMREGRAEEVTIAVDQPFGLLSPHAYRTQSLDLRPGDRLVMLTDGMLEHGAESLDLAALMEGTGDQHPREAALALTAAVLEANDGRLRDDATIMVLDWHGAH
ncbi:serine/threonine-protein phosphatase [Streptomyces albus subsp. chlorinus]|uniref:PP2C family protein-serine/threonine phosphatase n=1 Tax=Streptomyces albus TaxID=1888 RepID=UPI00157042A7|nr:PP2C family protein-serine/threonine phosphatase [Streptomyces albus]NSC20427.1 serine/threonine-protein phosphatase [Streptomyces albus subsp. chlorinus]